MPKHPGSSYDTLCALNKSFEEMKMLIIIIALTHLFLDVTNNKRSIDLSQTERKFSKNRNYKVI